jgi:hypothetical protein
MKNPRNPYENPLKPTLLWLNMAKLWKSGLTLGLGDALQLHKGAMRGGQLRLGPGRWQKNSPGKIWWILHDFPRFSPSPMKTRSLQSSNWLIDTFWGHQRVIDIDHWSFWAPVRLVLLQAPRTMRPTWGTPTAAWNWPFSCNLCSFELIKNDNIEVMEYHQACC